MNTPSTGAAYAALSLAAVLWGGSIVAQKLALGSFSAVEASVLRDIGGLAILLATWWWQEGKLATFTAADVRTRLRELGHKVSVQVDWDGVPVDALLAVLFVVVALKLPLLSVLWWLIARNPEWPGTRVKWSPDEQAEILAAEREQR